MKRHKWQKVENAERTEFVCKDCGIKKWNIYLGYGKNGHAALYILRNGERTSYKPDCSKLNKDQDVEASVASKA